MIQNKALYEEFLEKIVPHLVQVYRWGDDSHKGFPKEDVWQHTKSAIVRARELYEIHKQLLFQLNMKDVEETLLFHDAPEAFARHKDIDYADPEREKKKKENSELEVFKNVLIGKYGFPEYQYRLYANAEELASKEASFAKLVDLLDGYLFHWVHLSDSRLKNLEEHKNCWDRHMRAFTQLYFHMYNVQDHLFSKLIKHIYSELFRHLYRLDNYWEISDPLREYAEAKVGEAFGIKISLFI